MPRRLFTGTSKTRGTWPDNKDEIIMFTIEGLINGGTLLSSRDGV